MRNMRTRTILSLMIAALLCGGAAMAKPLKVYILVGQSNMLGHAGKNTIPWMAKDPKTRALHDLMVDPEGNPRVYDDVRVSYITDYGTKEGALTTGFGAGAGTIGPELAFGITMHEALQEPILIIKTAWGGRSLHTDFRSPSAPPYKYTPEGIARLTQRDKITEKELYARKAEKTGAFYRKMIEHVKSVLADPGKVHPAYNEKDGYEIAGLVWFQGWNDMCNSGTYPNRGKPGGYDLYIELLCDFIRDVRKDLTVPQMPIVIGVMGVNGSYKTNPKLDPRHATFQQAMAAPAAMDEFKDSVFAVHTGFYWDTLQARAQDKKWQVRAEVKKLKKEGKFKVAPKDDSPRAAHEAMLASRRAEMKYEAKRLDEVRTPEEQEAAKGISNKGFHYLGSAKILSRAGEAFANALINRQGNE